MFKIVSCITLVLLGLVFSQMTEKCFADAAAQLEQAESYEESGDYQQAELIYQNIITNYPGTDYALRARRDLTTLYIQWDRQSQAETAYEQFLAEFFDHNDIAEAIHGIADRYAQLEKYQKARELHQYVIENWPKTEAAMWSRAGLAICNIALDDDPNAQADVDWLIADFNDHPDLPEAVFVIGEQYYNEAFRCENEGLDEQAEDSFRKTIAIWERIITDLPASAPYTARAYYFSAVCYRFLGEYENAIEYYQEIVDNWPLCPYGWDAKFMIGHCSEELSKSGPISR